MSSPTQRTLKRLRAAGYLTAVTERWNAYSQTRQDLFGWIDLVAIRPDKPGVLGIQTTSRPNAAARLAKLIALPAVRVWLAAGNRCEVWDWAKRGRLWNCRRRVVGMEELVAPFPLPTAGD